MLSNEKTCQLSLLNIREKKKKLYIHDLLDVINCPTKLQFIRIRKDFFFFLSQNCLTLLWHWNTIKINESGMNGLSSMSTTIMHSLTFIIIIMSEKIATLNFLPHADNRPGRPSGLILIIILTSFMRAKKQTNKQIPTNFLWSKKAHSVAKLEPLGFTY